MREEKGKACHFPKEKLLFRIADAQNMRHTRTAVFEARTKNVKLVRKKLTVRNMRTRVCEFCQKSWEEWAQKGQICNTCIKNEVKNEG